MHTSDQTIARARRLRRTMSLPEVLLWQCLRGRQFAGHKIRRQQPFGPFVLDFYCRRAKLAIEVDGAHHGLPGRAAHDDERDAWLRSQGVRVLRIPAQVILADINAVSEPLREALGGAAFSR